MNANLPDSWPLVKLGVCLRRRKDTVMPSTLDDPIVGLVGLEDIQDGGRGGITVRPTKPSDIDSLKTRFQVGDILYGKLRPYLNKVGIAQSDGLCSTEIWAFTTEPFLDPRFAAHYLASSFFVDRVESLTKGANLPRLDSESFDSISIPLPPLSEQQRIVDILQEAEEIRHLRAQAEAKTAELIPALFQAGFAHSLSQSGKNRKIRLEEIADVQGGIQVTRARENAPLKVPYLRVANVQRDALDLAEIKEIGVTETELERTRLQKGDILVVEGHGNLEELGRAAIWSGELETCTHQNHLIRVHCKPGIEPSYVLSMLNSSLGRQHFKTAGNTTSGLNTISTSIVRSFRLPAPSHEAMNEFAALRAAALGLRGPDLQKTNLLANKLLTSLSAHAFTGRLTENWRKTNQAKSAFESASRDIALAGHQFPKTIRIDLNKLVMAKERSQHEAISADQQALLHAIEDHFTPPNPSQAVWFTAELLSRREGGAWTGNARAAQNLLAVLVTRGLVLAASREQVDEITEEAVFGTAYRLPMRRYEPDSGEEGEPFPGDFGRQTEMERLAERLYKMRLLP